MTVTRKQKKLSLAGALAVSMLLMTSTQGQLTLDSLRSRHLKQDPRGAPRMFEQMDFM
jgi:hypothetical protein